MGKGGRKDILHTKPIVQSANKIMFMGANYFTNIKRSNGVITVWMNDIFLPRVSSKNYLLTVNILIFSRCPNKSMLFYGDEILTLTFIQRLVKFKYVYMKPIQPKSQNNTFNVFFKIYASVFDKSGINKKLDSDLINSDYCQYNVHYRDVRILATNRLFSAIQDFTRTRNNLKIFFVSCY